MIYFYNFLPCLLKKILKSRSLFCKVVLITRIDTYQDFFVALEKAMFLQAHAVD